MSSWQQICEWLSVRSPTVAAAIRPPASENEIGYVQQELGDRLIPNDLVQWWRESDGYDWSAGPVAIIPPSYAPLSVSRCLNDYKMKISIEGPDIDSADSSDGEPAGTYSYYFLPEFFPIAADGGGSYLFVDLRRGAYSGCVMEWALGEGCREFMLWSNVGTMLDEVAECVSSGTPVMRRHVSDKHDLGLPAFTYRVHVDDDGSIEWKSSLVIPDV